MSSHSNSSSAGPGPGRDSDTAVAVSSSAAPSPTVQCSGAAARRRAKAKKRKEHKKAEQQAASTRSGATAAAHPSAPSDRAPLVDDRRAADSAGSIGSVQPRARTDGCWLIAGRTDCDCGRPATRIWISAAALPSLGCAAVGSLLDSPADWFCLLLIGSLSVPASGRMSVHSYDCLCSSSLTPSPSSAATTAEHEDHSEPDEDEPAATAADVERAMTLVPGSDLVALQMKALCNEALECVKNRNRELRCHSVSSRFGKVEWIPPNDRDNSAASLFKLPLRNSDAVFLVKIELSSLERNIYAGQ